MPLDMKQIAGLFNDCIETIRNEKHNNLEQMAIDWLRDARYKLMRDIETEYYKLAASIANPTQQQGWALYPHDKLTIHTIRYASILRLYATAITNNIQELMDTCGFNSTVTAINASEYGFCSVDIKFPARLRNEDIPRTLRVKDSIDTAVASSFARLIIDGK
ncbi:hypothetical protein PILCRDRAFT_813260 [Piloderma croceum F 1598]|uniref:Uncharacterized protein n=1 Tax=Piloderma croceum (strain F 1598) TaxID=765440 RepID=A0A0C3GC78_PILCF|nr:hypothetical protein PILCRDRAFT_813260 [Piloderma croceum F 1598]